ncbi:PREDICTED: nucleolar protein 16-like [Tarenaya hassleriana]|uniref:nucleolar protein 16-like n=1 Tax=Tarenaya hassleriana TaxID=28532 RepID=UPI00053C7E7D|nr:PREDICTED: nucleolar protein 16-like [Tarenaya hassleriana]
MGRSRRKYKNSRAKVRVGLPRRNPNVFKPAFNLPPKLRSLMADDLPSWDDNASVVQNYKSFGVVSNPNLLGVRSRTVHLVQADSLNVPPPPEPTTEDPVAKEFDPIDSGSDLEEDDLKTALGKQRKDRKHAPLQPLTATQRKHIGRLIEKFGDDYKAMARDTKLNAMQHTVAALRKLCTRYHMHKDKNPMLVPS